MIAPLLSPSTPVAIAHRGGSLVRPENTLAAFEHAVGLGVDALECDVHLSRDGDAVVIHDATLERTTDATGPVSACTADELAKVDAGCRFSTDGEFPFRGQGHGIPRLSDLLERCSTIPIVIEIKGSDRRVADRVIDLVLERGASDRVVVGGFSHTVMTSVRERSPGLATSASEIEVQSALRRAWFRLSPRRTGYRVFQVPVSLRGRRVLTRPFARVLARARIPVHAWIVNEIDDMERLLDWGVSGLISDRPDRAVAVIKDRHRFKT